MSRRKVISQREARATAKELATLREREVARLRRWSAEFPGGVNIGSVSWDTTSHVASAVHTAQLLGHVVVVRADGKLGFRLYAVAP